MCVTYFRKLEFEKAYCLYRLNQVPDAYKIIDNIQNSSLKVKELKAQILYRLEKYEECFAVYRDIIKNSNDEYEDERETNLAAVLVHLALEGSVSLKYCICYLFLIISIISIYFLLLFISYLNYFLFKLEFI